MTTPQNDDPIKPLSCETCDYVMPSYTSSTGLRCGLKYFQSPPFLRKLQRMEHHPEVKKINACEAWKDRHAS